MLSKSKICEMAWQKFASAKVKGALFDLNLSKEVLLDLETTHVLFCNPKFVNNIRDSPQALQMSSNGGMMRITQKADLPGLFPSHIEPAETWFSQKAITNLLSFKCLNNIYCIIYNSKKDKAFIVHCGNFGLTNLCFVEHPSGLHILEQPDGDSGSTFVQTAEENMKMFTN